MLLLICLVVLQSKVQSVSTKIYVTFTDRSTTEDTSEEGWTVLLKDIPLLFLNGSIFIAQGMEHSKAVD